ncbi:MAG: type II CRISPR RNA-guided endonuclease Cas9 [Lachnospiraceae bacterium]|nr:type II CRISPR RNA-guided endonuclease Cas9 [Lachnospiraceae bacterium]
MEKKTYYLGLDMGTNSVGWAVTDPEYHLLRAKGKDLWGIREFEEASTAADRRTHRISRRRRQREVVRIGILKSYFADEISKTDPDFYQRLENSKYHLEDKDEPVRTPNGIFNDKDYDDKEYYHEFPTIFHLRDALIKDQVEVNDRYARLLYLALLNMFKHRGHFLAAGLSSTDDTLSVSEAYEDFVFSASEVLGMTFPENINSSELETILSSRAYSRTQKVEKILSLLEIDRSEKKKAELVRSICGLKTDTDKIFADEETQYESKIDFSFMDSSYEDKEGEIISLIGEEKFGLIESMKRLCDAGQLSEILGGNKYLSSARVEAYEIHKKDLANLKSILKQYADKDTYDKLLRSEDSGSYSAYVNSVNSNKKQRRSLKGRTKEDFYKNVKKVLSDIAREHEDPLIQEILARISNESFMPKQLTNQNGIIPNQIHLSEMKAILKNAEKNLPFLKEKDDSGLSVSERICKLFAFQIPYYVGPVSINSAKNGGNGWVVRKEGGEVYPWNIESKIDIGKTQDAFIKRLIRDCTYISGEKVLPKDSLLYEKYCVLNEINNLKIDGERISPELKQQIYNELYLSGKRVTKRALIKYLQGRDIIKSEEQLSGVDIALNNYLSSYGKFSAVFGEKMREDSTKERVENIISLCTIYGTSKKFLRERLEEEYGKILTNDQIKRICSFKFNDWGRLSKEFLELPGCSKEDGEIKPLIQAMWDSNLNMMELINSNEYTYNISLKEKQNVIMKTLQEFEASDLDEYYFSAPVKRMIWQTLLVIKEISQVIGNPPARVFVEMTRSHQDKPQRTVSRKNRFLDLYKNVKDESHDWSKIIESADSSGKIRSKKMYLYLTQMGKDMYTGEDIDLDNLFNDNIYDIDHIYPRHFVKDDNLDNNMVLVDKRKNSTKKDKYPLDADIHRNCKNLWKRLRTCGLINEEKYSRLTCNMPFTDNQMAGFIARQLVETGQGTKGITDLLKGLLPDSTVVYVKASNVSEFRHERNIPKSRLVNEFHHAHDAYLNIVVGNVYHVKFTQDPRHFISYDYRRDPEKNNYHLSRMFDWDVIRGNEKAWIASVDDGPAGTISTVKKTLAKNSPLLTRMTFETHGKISEETLCPAVKAKPGVYIPLKSSNERLQNVQKYGGFKNVSVSYFFLVEYNKDKSKKKERERSIEAVPVYLTERLEDKSALEQYCKEQLGLKEPSIIIRKIRKQTLIKRDGYLFYLSAKSESRLILNNAVSLCLPEKWIFYIRKIEVGLGKGYFDDVITSEKNSELYEVLIDKYANSVFSKRPNFNVETLIRLKNEFEEFTIEKQGTALLQILTLSQIGKTQSDMRVMGLSENAGLMRVSKKLDKNVKMEIINQSVTGIFENKVDLNTV